MTGEKMTKETKTEIEDISMEMAMEAVAFEKEHGKILLLKSAVSAVCRIIVDKGVCTAAELQDAMRSTMKATARAKQLNETQPKSKPKSKPKTIRKRKIPVDNPYDYPY